MPLTKQLRWLTLVGSCFFILNCHAKDSVITMAGKTMGTSYHIKVVVNDKTPNKVALQKQIDTALERINDQMSTYRPHSELSRFNQLASNKKVNISPAMEQVVATGIDLYGKTNGALDITLGPLVNLWGFGPNKRPTAIPSLALIEATKKKTGIQYLHLHRHQLSKTNPDLYVDLSSIAKGYGVDTIAALLSQYQPQGYMVEIGGEISTFGTKGLGRVWHIAIEKPTGSGKVQQIITPKNLAMATSGNYRNYYQENGQRFTHIIDPRTGYPVKHHLASVTVLNASSMVADGYATAMMVLGTQAALALAEKEKLPVMLIEKRTQGFVTLYSSAFKQILLNAPQAHISV